MNWDQQLIKACTETDGTPHPHTDHVLTGAKWQRDQLRTDEAIERVAKAEFIREQADYEYFDREDWEDQHPSNQDVLRSRARIWIAALLGDTP